MADRAATPTRKNLPLPSLMLVGVDDTLTEALKTRMAPIPVIRVGHLAAASERILLTRPLVVVVSDLGAGRDDMDAFRELARGCGTEIVRLGDLPPDEDVPAYVEQLVIAFSRKRSGQFIAVESRERSKDRGENR